MGERIFRVGVVAIHQLALTVAKFNNQHCCKSLGMVNAALPSHHMQSFAKVISDFQVTNLLEANPFSPHLIQSFNCIQHLDHYSFFLKHTLFFFPDFILSWVCL